MVLGGYMEVVGEDIERHFSSTRRGSWRRLRHYPGVHVVLKYTHGTHLSMFTLLAATPTSFASRGCRRRYHATRVSGSDTLHRFT